MKTLRLLTFFVALSIQLDAQRESYSCKIFKQITTDIYQNNQNLAIINELPDVTLVVDPVNGSTSLMSECKKYTSDYLDSLMIALDSFNVIRDSIILLKGNVLIIDTMNFLTPLCETKFGNISFKASNNISDARKYPDMNVRIINAIKIYKERLVIVMSYLHTDRVFLSFHFDLDNSNIRLTRKNIIINDHFKE